MKKENKLKLGNISFPCFLNRNRIKMTKKKKTPKT